MEKIFSWLRQNWRLITLGLAVFLVAYVLLFRGLGSLTGHLYSTSELSAHEHSHSLKTILQDPLNAPHKAVVWAGIKLGHHSMLATRIATALFALCIGLLYYWIIAHWYSTRVAVLSTLLFVTSSSYLHIARYGTALILQMYILAFVAGVVLYQRSRHEKHAIYILAVMAALCFYIPGMVWLLVAEFVLLRKHIKRVLHRFGQKHVVILSLCGLITLAPLLWAIAQRPAIILSVAGLPTTLPSWSLIADQSLHLISSIVYRGYWPSEYWLYGAPLLNITEIILCIIGIIMLVQRPISRANRFVCIALAISTLLVCLGGSANIALLIPLIYLTIAGGIYHLLDQWLAIFPRNIVARGVGIGFMCVLVMFSVFYHLRAYTVAWPQAPETRTVYHLKQPT